jgi:hypothetical protein
LVSHAEQDGDAGSVDRSAGSNQVGVVMHDANCAPSLVVVNPTLELIRPDFRHAVRGEESPLHLGTVAPQSVVEFPLEDTLLKGGTKRRVIWGEAEIEKIWSAAGSLDSSIECYLLLRDPNSRQPFSVCAI